MAVVSKVDEQTEQFERPCALVLMVAKGSQIDPVPLPICLRFVIASLKWWQSQMWMYNVIFIYLFVLNSLENLFKSQKLNLAKSMPMKIW